MLRKVKQLLSNFEAERWENLSNLRLAKKSVAYKKNSSVYVCDMRFKDISSAVGLWAKKNLHVSSKTGLIFSKRGDLDSQKKKI